MGITETLQIDEMIRDFNRMNKRQVSFYKNVASICNFFLHVNTRMRYNEWLEI